MKRTFTKLMAALALLTFLSFPMGMWGQETSTLTFTAACGGSGTADDGAEWTVTSDGTESTYDSNKGIHYGTNSAQVKYIQLSTSDISGTITKVVVNASTASGVTATVGVTVGGSAFGGSAQDLSTTATNYTFNGSASGEIVVLITKPSKAAKALYCKSIAVTYTAGPATYTVTYDGNGHTGGTVPTDSHEYESGDEVTVLGSGNLAKTGHAFSGWNTAADGSGDSYAENDTFEIDGNTTLYAQWNAYTVAAQSNNNSFGTVSVSGFTITASPASGYQYASPAYTVSSGTATVAQSGNTFTVTPSSNCTITINFEAIPTHTATFSVNGTTSPQEVAEGAAITFPANPENIEDKVFVGWTGAAISDPTDTAPDFVTSATMGNADVTFYAVFADVTPGAEQAASMIINGNTPGVPSSYGTANAFDECILNGKKFQIQQMYKNGDKLQWRASGNDNGTGTMYNSDALQHLQSIVLTYADNDNNKNFTINVGTSANPTSGTTITPTISENSYTFDCSNGNYDYFVMTNGAGAGYLTSIVINYMTGTPDTYSNYCTTVVLPSVQRPVITVAENPFLFSTTVTITCATEGASIQYSFDNENWNDYSDPLTINETKTIYAKASDGTEESSVASVTATKNLAEPTIAIDHSGIANTNVFMGTAAGSLAASVTYNDSPVEGATVTWSGDNDNVATINTNGAVTLVAEGSVTFTASFAGNSDYSAKTATYEMAVTNVNPNTGTITFGTGHVVINSASVTGNDNLGNTWSIVTEGTDSYTSNADYYQVGSSKKPATSITFTTTLPENRFVTGFSAKFGGFSDTAGDVTLKIGETTVGSGSLNGSSDVTVTNNNTASGNVLTVTVTNIDKGVKCYYISYTLAPVYTLSNITGYTGEKDHYYLIASPVTVDPSTVAGMTEGDFDLYRFNQAAALEWENWKNEESDNYHFNLVPGTGYLYAKKATTENQTYSFTLTGIPYAGNGTIDLDYDANAEFPGFNLIGNPFGSAATLDMPFYRMAEGGAGFTAKIEDLTNTIAGMEGVFVEASTIGEKATFTPARNSEPQGIAYLSINVNKNRGEFVDNAIVRFDGGQQLGKFSFRQGSTKVYMTENSKDYAVVRSAAEAEMPVSFRASENGTYTLAVEAENVEMNYLHLIDNLTGTDVDLLATPSYTFEANTTDYASRFRLVFSANSISEDADGNNAFAYYNGSSWTVSNVGEATLQVVDMMGRVLSSETISGNANVTLNQAAGIYMLRLVNGENVKVQKVVVR